MSRRALYTSRYNFFVPTHDGALLYNAATGAIIRLLGRDAQPAAQALAGKRARVTPSIFPENLQAQLRTGKFIVSSEVNELDEIRTRFQQARADTPMVLTLTTTMDCNLGCYYCYEDRSADRLQLKDVTAVVQVARDRLARSGKRSLHVDWYGGEPLLNVEFLEVASAELQTLCVQEGVVYSASVISNGTCWPEDVSAFVARHKIRQVQVSFDGLGKNHTQRRRYRQGYVPENGASSFDRAACLVDRLLDVVRVDLRLNIDRGNRGDVVPLICFMRSRTWFNRRFPLVIQPARLASYSARSSFMRKSELSLKEFDAIRTRIRLEVGSDATIEESETPHGFPYPKTSVCAALAKDSVVIGADGRQFRCGLQVGEHARSIGDIRQSSGSPFVILDQPGTIGTDQAWWDHFDPTALPTCSVCSFLPICWGGCPKRHLESDLHAIKEQGAFWSKNLPRLIGKGASAAVPPQFEFSDEDQFR